MAVIETIGQTRFGQDADEHRHRLLSGWSHAEDGFTWAVGRDARFTIPVPDGEQTGTALLELDLNPFMVPGSTVGQVLELGIDGVRLAADRIRGEGAVAYVLPPGTLRAGSDAVVALHMPQAARPADLGFGTDRRALGFMFRSATLRRIDTPRPVPHRSLPPIALPQSRDASVLAPALLAGTGLVAAELLGDFESLGHNCEFGIAQRHCGAEPLALLRFSGITLPHLLAGLDAGFAGLGDPAQVEIRPTSGARPEFMIHDTRHGLSLHTMRYVDETDAAALAHDASRHLAFLHRKFTETLECDGRIFVFQRPGQLLEAQARPLLARLQARGRNALLFVVEGDEHPPGTVQELGYGFFRGWVDRAAPPDNVGLCNLAAWISNCTNARRLWEVQIAMARAG